MHKTRIMQPQLSSEFNQRLCEIKKDNAGCICRVEPKEVCNNPDHGENRTFYPDCTALPDRIMSEILPLPRQLPLPEACLCQNHAFIHKNKVCCRIKSPAAHHTNHIFTLFAAAVPYSSVHCFPAQRPVGQADPHCHTYG